MFLVGTVATKPQAHVFLVGTVATVATKGAGILYAQGKCPIINQHPLSVE